MVGGDGNDLYDTIPNPVHAGDTIIEHGGASDLLRLRDAPLGFGELGWFQGTVWLEVSPNGKDLIVHPVLFNGANLPYIRIFNHFSSLGHVEAIQWNGQSVLLPTTPAEIDGWNGSRYRSVSLANIQLTEGPDGTLSGSISATGGSGSQDTVSFSGLRDSVTANVANGVASIFDSLSLSHLAPEGAASVASTASAIPVDISNMENVTGGSANDDITGSDAANYLQGCGGDDHLVGLAGADTLDGGDGMDILDGGPGADILDGAGGIDTVSYGSSPAAIVVDLGDNHSGGGSAEGDILLNVEIIEGSIFADSLIGGIMDDTLRGGGGADYLEGQAGNDNLDGGSGADFIVGGFGNDTFVVNEVGDQVVELPGQGADVIFSSVSYAISTGSEIETLSTLDWNSNAAINLTGNGLANWLVGNAGVNVLDGMGGADILQGRGGNDLYIVENSADGVYENAGEGIDTIYSSVSYTMVAGQEIETLSTLDWNGTASISFGGNELANWLIGNAGSNLLDGGAGADILQGRTGNDLYIVDNAGDQVFENAGEGVDAVYASVSYALRAGSEVETLSTRDWNSAAAIDLTGNELANWLIGNAGSNLLNGGAGADILQGRGGNDLYIVDNSADGVYENVGEGIDAVYSSVSYSLAAGSEVETLSTLDWNGTASISFGGNELANWLIGNAGSNLLDGGAGADILQGRTGNDLYIVDNAGDQVFENAGEGNDAVYTSVSYTLAAGADVETLSSRDWNAASAISLTGNALANSIFGNAGANILDGGGGADYLQGMGGADTFAFTSALGGANVDTIADFVSGTDKIALSRAVFSGLGLGALGPGAFVAGTSAQDSDDRIVYNSATGQLFFDADGNGAGAAVLFATLNGHPALTAGDFTVI